MAEGRRLPRELTADCPQSLGQNPPKVFTTAKLLISLPRKSGANFMKSTPRKLQIEFHEHHNSQENAKC
jgi:hypothetical protein